MVWKKGESGNPRGRLPGARNKIQEATLAIMAADIEKYGAEVLARVRSEDPCAYMRLFAALLPTQHQEQHAVSYVAALPEPAATVDEWLREALPTPTKN